MKEFLHHHLKHIRLHQKSRLIFIIKLTISLGLIIYLTWLVDWERVGKILKETDKTFLFGILLVALFRLIFATFRWQRILLDNQVVLSFWFAYASYLVGSFYNIFLPGVTGGDVIRAGRCIQRTQCPWGTATASVILERISGMLATLLIAFVIYLCFPNTLSSLIVIETNSLVTVMSALGLFVMLVLTLGRRKWLKWLPSQNLKGLKGFMVSGLRTFGVLQEYTLVLILLSSVLFQALDIVITFLLARAIGINLSLLVFFAIIPLVYVAIVLPISLGGLGVREGMLTFLLAQFGVTTSDAVMLSFLVYVTHVLIAALGGIVQFIETFTGQQFE